MRTRPLSWSLPVQFLLCFFLLSYLRVEKLVRITGGLRRAPVTVWIETPSGLVALESNNQCAFSLGSVSGTWKSVLQAHASTGRGISRTAGKLWQDKARLTPSFFRYQVRLAEGACPTWSRLLKARRFGGNFCCGQLPEPDYSGSHLLPNHHSRWTSPSCQKNLLCSIRMWCMWPFRASAPLQNSTDRIAR